MIIWKNLSYESFKPFISIITPVFNRDKELIRTNQSVNVQTYKNIEHIIINDGSTIDIDNLAKEYMDNVSYPVIYIKKDNGGVHTARNVGYKFARGAMSLDLDSDDELLPDSLSKLVSEWGSLPKDKQEECREICSLCVDQDNNLIGDKFPSNINELKWKDSLKLLRNTKGEKVGFYKTSIMKDNPWPEPNGITFVMEGILWIKLQKKYRTWCFNEPILKAHLEDNNSITRNRKKSIQNVNNNCWNYSYILNHWKSDGYTREYGFFSKLTLLSIQQHILRRHKVSVKEFKLNNGFQKFISVLIFIPTLICSYIYEKNKM